MSFTAIILPEGKYKKYINVVLGLTLIVVMLSPFYRFLNTQHFDLDDLIDSLGITQTVSANHNSSIPHHEQMREQAIKNEFIASLRLNTEQLIKSSGFELIDIAANFDIQTGEIHSLHLEVSSLDTSEAASRQQFSIIRIEPIRIGSDFIADEEHHKEISELKNMLADRFSFYNLDAASIHITYRR